MQTESIPKNTAKYFEKSRETVRSVSIVMATYNGEKFLKEQLDSLLRQEGINVKILIRDDGSTDGTVAILNEYQSKGLLKWYTGMHLGVPKGYLDLLKHSPETEYYAFCDQDDVWDNDKLLIAVNALKQFPKEEPSIYYCGQRLVDENLNLISVHKIDSKRSAHTNFLLSNIAGCTAVFNRTLRDIVNSEDPEFISMHDSWTFKVCLALGGNYVADPQAHISYRQHEGNVLGLTGNLRGKIKRALRYINESEPKKQLENLYECYGDKMTSEYELLTKEICEYDQSVSKWFKMLINKDFDFKSVSLNVTVRLKILLKKL